MGAAAFSRDVVIVGGCGRVGLPLGLALASRGLTVTLYDTNDAAVATMNAGSMPFSEEGAGGLLTEALATGRLTATTESSSVSTAEHPVVVVGTRVDEHLNPNLGAVPRALERCAEHLVAGQLVILRSTVYPGVTFLTEKLIQYAELDTDRPVIDMWGFTRRGVLV